MAAAIEAARAGLPCTLIDEAPRLGGQIYRQISEAFSVRDPGALGKDYRRGEALRAELRPHSDRVTILPRTAVLGLSADREIMWTRDATAGTFRADQLILATGAHERSVPFPGWTLPGVMTAGGAQRLVKTMRVRPGRRAMVAGTGPLLLVVANQLQAVGTEVVGVLEASRHPSWPRFVGAAWGEWSLLKDAFDYWLGLRRARIPLRFNQTVFEAHGISGVEAVTYGPIDPATWRPIRERAKRVEVDLLVVGFGLVPNAELTTLAGCDHRHVPEIGGWVPVRDGRMETTEPGVFAAGDGAGVRGAQVAVMEGRVAGITAAEHAGLLTSAEADRRRAPLNARLKRFLRVREILDEMSRLRPGLDGLATPDTIVCRCEEVTLAEFFFY
jgi:hydrogen cyanide synthase HcnB